MCRRLFWYAEKSSLSHPMADSPQQCDSDNVAAYGVDFIPDLTYFCGSVCYVMHFFALMKQYGNHASDDCQQYQITSYDFCLQ